MRTSIDDVQKLLDEARLLADGPVKIAVHEEAVRVADLLNEIDWQFYTRHELVNACFSGGDPERMLVALSWSLAKCDELGSCFSESSLLWGCKFALSYIAAFPHISRAQIESLYEDTLQRFRKYGASLRIPYLYGMYNELVMGEPKRAAKFRPLWLKSPHDGFTEPPDWETYFEALYHQSSGKVDKALELGLPMIDGRVRSPDVSFWMVDMLLMELLKRGQQQVAVAAHVKACRQCTDNPKYLGHMGVHLAFATLTGNYTRATNILNKHLSAAVQSRVPSSQFTFFMYAWLSTEHLYATTSKPARLRLPKEFPLWKEEGIYEWSALASWFETRTHELEAQFNARNENTYFTKLIKEAQELRACAQDWPVSR